VAPIYQVVWEWNGSAGLPGFTNLFYDASASSPTDALAACTKSRLLISGIGAVMPSTVTMSLRNDVRVLNDVDGTLINIYTVVGPANVVGTIADRYSEASGGVIDWLTNTVHGTRRMQGRTFVVPLSSLAYDGAGKLAATTVTALGTAAEAMRTATGPVFGVWGRPKFAKPATVPPTIVRPGLWGPAISSRIPTKVAVLTSRRD
jgi:hypothetical protein